jgi:tetrahydromethanopterin S-methyltransferase subunit F
LRLKILTLFAGVTLFASPADAQRATNSTIPITPGSRVRVKAQSMLTPLIANFLEQRGDSLVFIEEERGRGVWTFSLAQIERLETTAGNTAYDKQPIGRNALIGGGVGLGAGLVFAAVFSPSDTTKEYSRLLTGALGAGIGAGIGAYIGSRVKTERWVNVPLPRQLSLIPNRRGGFSISIGW